MMDLGRTDQGQALGLRTGVATQFLRHGVSQCLLGGQRIALGPQAMCLLQAQNQRVHPLTN